MKISHEMERDLSIGVRAGIPPPLGNTSNTVVATPAIPVCSKKNSYRPTENIHCALINW